MTENYSAKDMLLYKLDRTLAIAGIIALGIWSLMAGSPDALNIAMACVGGLVGYVGGRTN